ncbi:MAG: hypothetical protein ACR2OE_16785 [Thermomicrobiales bacterium]
MTDNDLETLSNEDDSQGGTVVSKTPDEAKADAVAEDAKGGEPSESTEARASGTSPHDKQSGKSEDHGHK